MYLVSLANPCTGPGIYTRMYKSPCAIPTGVCSCIEPLYLLFPMPESLAPGMSPWLTPSALYLAQASPYYKGLL